MSIRARFASESGLSLYEVLVAILVLVVGLMGLYVSIGTSNGAVAAGETTAVMAQAAQQQLEWVEALPYNNIANNSKPAQTSTTDTSNPTYYLSSSATSKVSCGASCGYYIASLSGSSGEPIDSDSTYGKVAPGPVKTVVADPNVSTCASTSTATCRIVLSVYTFITWPTDTICSSCSYKRITVAVKNAGSGPPRQPYYLSTFIGPKNSANYSGTTPGANPLASGSTYCVDTINTVCTH